MYMTDKLGHRSAEKGMGVLVYGRLNMSQKAVANSIQTALKEVQHSSLNKSRYCLQFWAPQHSTDTQANELSGGPQGRGGWSTCPLRSTWVSWTRSALRRGSFGASNRSPALVRSHQGDRAGLLGESESTRTTCCSRRGSGWV